jgi:hypothetical protein
MSRKPSARIVIRKITALIVAVSFLGVSGLGLVILARSESVSKPIRVAFIGVEGALLVGVLYLGIEYGLPNWQARRRKRQESEKELRNKLLEPARSPLTPADLQGGQSTESGPESMPATPKRDVGDSPTTYTE